MNAQQTSIYAMFTRTFRVLDDNKAIWSANSKFSDNYTTFSNNIKGIGEAQKQQETDKTGITQDKGTARETLAELSFEMASGIRSFAADNNNQELELSVKFTEAGLASMAEARLTATSEMIYAAGAKNLVDLSEYGVKAESLSALKAAIDAFKSAQPETRLAINTGSQATTDIRKLFTETSNPLKRQLDTKMIIFKKTNLDFYNAYFQARNIIEPGVPKKKEEAKK